MWRYCPNHVNAPKNKLDFAAAHVEADDNVGYVESNLHKLLGIPYTQITDTFESEGCSNGCSHLEENEKQVPREGPVLRGREPLEGRAMPTHHPTSPASFSEVSY